ncbi:MAG TPA: SpoIID/LytB domain-containing protein, partial [Myxococcaceae bacterium]
GSKARPYAGVFSFRPLPDRPPERGATPREARARRGSEVIFRTTLSSYVAGVLAAERAGLTGEPAVALAQVIAHDARVERHPGRPLCDTTHCQAFLGTATPTAEVRRALELPELPTDRWLPYFRGGDEAWEVRRPTAEVRATLGEVQRLGGDGRTVEVTRPSGVERVPCERVRAALRLQGCPTDGVVEGETVRLRGRGRGHGLGLDVEAARRSGLPADELLRRAYGLDTRASGP